jgi:NTE family protein
MNEINRLQKAGKQADRAQIQDGPIMSHSDQRTAFVFAGGGSLGAVQVGMLREMMRAGVSADLVVGSSVGAMNAAYFAGAPHAAGVDKLEKVWRGLRRHDVFPVTLRSVLGFMVGADNLIDPSNLRKLIEHNIPFPNLEDAPIPAHVVATNLGGAAVCLSSDPAVEAVLASAAIPAAFPSVHIGENYLIDGAVGGNTPILTAADLGASRIIVPRLGSLAPSTSRRRSNRASVARDNAAYRPSNGA